MKMQRLLLAAFGCLLLAGQSYAQVSGAVFRDYNGNGTRDTNEPFLGGVVVRAYNSSDSLVSSVVTTAPLTGSTNYTFTPPAFPVRVEYTVPASAGTLCINPAFDFFGYAGATYGSNVKFLTAATSSANVALNAERDFVRSLNPYYYAVRQTAGDPLAGSGGATTRTGMEGTPYNAGLAVPGTTSPAQRTMPLRFIGNCYGVAYSKQAGKLFTSATVKRHFGLGPLGSGGIYILDTALGSPAVASSVQFYNMDANGHPTRTQGAGVPAYGSGTSFQVNSASSISFLGTVDPVTTYPAGFGVVGSNTARGLTGNPATASYDVAAFAQVGTIGIGDIDISDDGTQLYVSNLYNRCIYRLTLNSATNPTAVTAVDSFFLPNPPLRNTLGGGFATTYAGDNADFYNGTKGFLRPYGLKFHRGKLLVGAVTTGEKTGTSTMDNNSGNPEYTDLWGYVFELNATSNSWASAPLLQFPLNFNRGTNGDTYNETFNVWRNTSWSTTINWSGSPRLFYTQAMLTDIEVDPDDGSLVLGFRDRIGDQVGHFNYQFSGTGLLVATAMGEILRAYRKSDCTYELESAGKEGPSSPKAATSGVTNGQGPGGGEFYFRDNVFDAGGTRNVNWHLNCMEGSLAILPGRNEIMSTSMDPVDAWQQGIDWFSNTTGDNTRDHAMEAANGNAADGNAGKGFSMGDIEILSYDPSNEIGNRVWADANGNGIQDANEAGIGGVLLELFVDNNNDGVPDGAAIASTTSATSGTIGAWYFNDANITGDGDPNTAGTQARLTSGVRYLVRLATSGTGNDWETTNGGQARAGGDLVGYQLTASNRLGTGAAGLSNNDATLQNAIPSISVLVGQKGQNSHDFDFGFKPLATIGDRVWMDNGAGGGTANDGVQNGSEPGVAGITVTLYRDVDGAGGAPEFVIASTTTDAYGFYRFDNLVDGAGYFIQVTLPANYRFTTQTNTADNENAGATTGSDVNTATGRSYFITLSSGERELDIDAGIIFAEPTATASVGDRVWLDGNNNGIQDASEVGVSQVTVTLYQNGIAVATTITDANGNYLFTNVTPGANYSVGFSLPPAFVFSAADQGGNDNTDSDVNNTPGAANFGRTPTFTVTAGQQITNVDAGLVPQSSTRASLGDFVWEDLDRDGIQDAGEPGIAGISVALLDAGGNPIDADNNAGNGVQPLTTQTDAFGYYQFTNLLPGNYIVAFTAPTNYTISAAFQGSDVSVDNNANPLNGRTSLVTLLAGDRVSTIDCGMYNSAQALGATATLGNRVWLDTDLDGIQDAGEAGVAGVRVSLLNASGAPILDGSGNPIFTTTNAQGEYLFVNLTPGTYRVQFSNIPSGLSFTTPDQGGNDALDSDVNTATGVTNSVTLVAGQNFIDLDAGLQPRIPAGLGSLGDRVFVDLNNDGLQTAGEPGVPGVTVQLYSPGADLIVGNGDDVLIATTTTNALGQYLFTNLSAGSYYVAFSSLPASYTAASANVGTNDAADSDGGAIVSGVSTTGVYTLGVGEDNLTVDFGLVPPANTNTLGNYVWYDLNSDGLQDANEPGVPGVMAILTDVNGNIIDRDGNGTNGVQPYVSTTDANGFYLFTGLPNGTYRVQFSNLPDGFSLTAPSLTNTANGSDADLTNTRTTPVLLGTSNRNDLTLDAGLVTTRAALGNYVWDDLDRDGIQDASEPPVAGVTVTLFAGDGTTVLASAVTNASGQYFFPNLTAGNYVVGFSTLPRGTEFTTANATAENLGTDSDADPVSGRTAVITLAAGEINLNIDAGIRTIIPASVGDYVWLDINSNGLQDANEPGVGGVIATLYNSSNNAVGSAITDGKGGYLITNVTPGNGYYVIFSNLPGGSFTTQNVGGNTAANNSNANGAGQTLPFNVAAGDAIREIDAGIVGWPSGGVLPIGLLQFTAEKQRESVMLRWTTSNEINTAFMDVERSADGRGFQSIGRLQAAGFSSTALDYQMPDVRPFEGWNYYRIKTTDLDGQVSYSPVRTVRFVGAQELMVYPNPVRGAAQIQLPKSWLNQDVTIRLISVTGQELQQWRMRPVQTQQQLRFDELAAGSYLLQFSTVGESTINRAIQVIR